MQKLWLICLVHLFTPVQASAKTWDEVQRSVDYLSAKKHIANYLPDLAIPKITELLADPELDESARPPLLTLLGEAQVRAGTSGLALKTLDDPLLKEFSTAHLWRSYALVQLGRYRDAIGELDKINEPSMKENAALQTGKLHLALGMPAKAQEKLEPLLQTKDPSILKEVILQLVSVALEQDQLEKAETLLKKITPANPVEENLVLYLNGRLQLARGDRLAAVGTFQTLLNDPDISKNLTASLFHESTIALADSLALDGNEGAATDSLLKTLEKQADSPKLDDIFSRLRRWAPAAETTSLLAKLGAWAPAIKVEEPKDPPSGEPDPAPGITPAIPEGTLPASKPSKRSLYALAFLAELQLRSDDIEGQKKGRARVAQLQTLTPEGSPMLNRALIELGILELKAEQFEEALAIFSKLDENNPKPTIRAYAKALAGKASFALANPTKASQLYLEAKEIAKEVRATELSSLAALNAGITLLTSTRSKELDEITKNLDSPEARSFLILERGLFLASTRDLGARDLLISFLANFPDNPRTPEAALALAESAIFTPPFAPDLALEQITPLKFDLESAPLFKARRLLVLLALNTGIEQAQDFLTKAPNHPLAPRILFQLGQTYRNPAVEEDREIGKANLQFEILVEKYPESEFADAARYYSALTSIALKTESADKNATLRLRELIDKDGVLANEAAINLCSLLIDRDQQERALGEISNFLQNGPLPDSDRRRFLVMGADAANQIGQHEQAIAFYETLLKIKDLPASTQNRANYIRGKALEKLDRNVEALEAYYQVVNRNFDPNTSTSLEWKWFDKCGIEGALGLLENEKRWKAAIQLAEKIGKSGSPRAQDAREIAERLGREHHIPRDPQSAPEDEEGPNE